MLISLSVVNYALIENLEIDFEKGFSVITGETGAGKSIILGAISLIIGKRADLNALKDKSKKCIVEGIFDSKALSLNNFFKDNDLDNDDYTILRREILPSGKSRAFINDSPVKLSLLSHIGNMLVDIHSQHQTLQLTDASFQLNVLDSFVNKPTLLSDYQDIYTKYIEFSKKLIELQQISTKASKDEDYFQFQFNELNDAPLNVNEFEQLEERAKYLEHAEEVQQILAEAENTLNNENTSVIDSLQHIENNISKINEYLINNSDLSARLGSVVIELKDILYEIEQLNNHDDINPLELQQINDKLNNIYKLYQKHNVTSVGDLIKIRDDYENKLLNISSVDEEIISTKKQLSVIEIKLNDKASLLHKKRISSAVSFSKSIKNILTQLGMKDAEFVVDIEDLPNFTKTGKDKILFKFSANKGTETNEISKIASGGELSRLMLAIKSLITKKQLLPTIIFDEIDSGVSGKIAGKVSGILTEMATKHQIISITHLPQIASKADCHYKVYKIIEKNSTSSVIKKLDTESRLKEIAEMLSNEKITDITLKAARELMEK